MSAQHALQIESTGAPGFPRIAMVHHRVKRPVASSGAPSTTFLLAASKGVDGAPKPALGRPGTRGRVVPDAHHDGG